MNFAGIFQLANEYNAGIAQGLKLQWGEEAKQLAAQQGFDTSPNNMDGSPANAFVHAYASAKAAQRWGPEGALLAGQIREFYPFDQQNDPNNRNMDLYTLLSKTAEAGCAGH